ncbi:hypothetical protein EGR_11300 [Echinococcus granulosus]|uniref:Uncharacterized protein n=1 Tax=Echinococcus granulosus TaxID=6210 RepID=W6UK18_ECHGR|nr:hypothetical protein EGR_11300 [Echinococcus granulosus]EUB53849.1 hypothetical protein EGR_11300 [Echinococcus granulosus]
MLLKLTSVFEIFEPHSTEIFAALIIERDASPISHILNSTILLCSKLMCAFLSIQRVVIFHMGVNVQNRSLGRDPITKRIAAFLFEVSWGLTGVSCF